MHNHIEEAEHDCQVLLRRALNARQLNAFGEDGLGEHGRSMFPFYFTVMKIDVKIAADEGANLVGTAELVLNWYDSSQLCVCTDKNFERSVSKLLIQENIDPTALTLLPYEEQSPVTDVVSFRIDVPKLLDWT